MASDKALKSGSPSGFDRLRDAWREAERWPFAGDAFKRVHGAETRALFELKQCLDALEDRPVDDEYVADTLESPAERLADLLERGRGIDPDRARDDLYRQLLSRVVPDEIAMLRVLATRGVAPLCHIGGSRWPARGELVVTLIHNASTLGQEAGVLLRDYTPQYMSRLIELGLAAPGAADSSLAPDYELLLADTQIRRAMDTIRSEHRLYPRVRRRSVRLSTLGAALWRDCYGPAEAINRARAGW